MAAKNDEKGADRSGVAEPDGDNTSPSGADASASSAPTPPDETAGEKQSEKAPEKLYELAGKASVAGKGYRVRRGERVSHTAYSKLPDRQQKFFEVVNSE